LLIRVLPKECIHIISLPGWRNLLHHGEFLIIVTIIVTIELTHSLEFLCAPSVLGGGLTLVDPVAVPLVVIVVVSLAPEVVGNIGSLPLGATGGGGVVLICGGGGRERATTFVGDRLDEVEVLLPR